MAKKLTVSKKKQFIKEEKKAAKVYKKYGSPPFKLISKDEISHAKIISRLKPKKK